MISRLWQAWLWPFRFLAFDLIKNAKCRLPNVDFDAFALYAKTAEMDANFGIRRKTIQTKTPSHGLEADAVMELPGNGCIHVELALMIPFQGKRKYIEFTLN